jgi:hypothetical protein
MNAQHFDHVARVLGRSRLRRHLLLGLALSPFAGFVAPDHPPKAAARKRHKNKKRNKDKPPKPNAFGCLDVGKSCRIAAHCCSNLCEGKKRKRKCQAHDANGCAASTQSEECGGADVTCTTSFLEPGTCGTTTGNAGYCFAAGECQACKTDVECQETNGGQLGPSAACIRCADCPETGGTACVGPFGLPAINSERRLG